MTIDRAVMAFAGLVVLASLALAQWQSPRLAAPDSIRWAEPAPGLVHGLLPRRDDFQMVGRQAGQGVPVRSGSSSERG